MNELNKIRRLRKEIEAQNDELQKVIDSLTIAEGKQGELKEKTTGIHQLISGITGKENTEEKTDGLIADVVEAASIISKHYKKKAKNYLVNKISTGGV